MTLRAICDRIVPQPADRAPVPLAAMVDSKICAGHHDGYRDARLPSMAEAWQRGLAALNEEARTRFDQDFHTLSATLQDDLLRAMQAGTLDGDAWVGLPPDLFFRRRIVADIVKSYYAHPTAWSEIGFGGPASPRGYVRMDFDRRDSWEAAEAKPGHEAEAYRENIRGAARARGSHPAPSDAAAAPRATDGRAPDVFRPGAWTPMRQYGEDEPVRLRHRKAPAPAAAPSPAGWRKPGFRWWPSTPARIGGRWKTSPPMRRSRASSTGPIPASPDGGIRCALGSNNWGKSVGGSTIVHFAMVSLRFRPEWFRSRTLLGYGADWPLDWREMWDYYTEVEQALKIAGPVTYPWGPQRPRYPYRAHELNAAAKVLAIGAEALGIPWTETPLATVSAPRGASPPCVYRGFCNFGCATNAKQSALA